MLADDMDMTDAESLSNKQLDVSDKPAIVGYGKESVTLFSLGLSGSLIWGVGVIPSVMALFKVKKARQEITDAGGALHGFGLIKAGIALAITGIVNFLLSILMIVVLVWAIGQIPTWMNQAISEGQIGGVDVVDILPPVNLTELGLSDSTLNQIETILPEGQNLEEVDIGMLLSQLENSDSVSSLDPALLEELGISLEDAETLTLEDLLALLETY